MAVTVNIPKRAEQVMPVAPLEVPVVQQEVKPSVPKPLKEEDKELNNG